MLCSHEIAGLENITANDICSGRLKAVLALFFALSRYKQHAKQIKSLGITGGGLCIKADIHQQPQVVNKTLRSGASGNSQTSAVSDGLAPANKTSSGQLSAMQNANLVLVSNGSHQQQTPLQIRSLQNAGDAMVNR